MSAMKLRFTYILFALIAVVAFSNTSAGQGVYFDPSPTDVTAPVRLYIDITSSECNCPELQDVNPETEPLYIWTWHPFEDRLPVNGINVQNGAWDNRSEEHTSELQ